MKFSVPAPRLWRPLFQLAFLLWIIIIGVRFGLFVHHFEMAGQAPFYSRPPGVEGFLPIGALASLRHWLASGEFNSVHPAALVLFLTFVLMSLLAKKSFCSWLCPVGTLSEWLWKCGRWLMGENFQLWRWLDVLLRSIKYGLLLFFCKLLLLDMPSQALRQFLGSPYWALSDVKMLHFFVHISFDTLAVVVVLALLSLFFQNFWCRYLCPYGALLGLVSLFSPMKIRRDPLRCTACQRCRRACPALLAVDKKMVIRSVECTGCQRCVDSCQDDALHMTLPWLQRPLPRWAFPLLVVVLYSGGVAAGMLSGHWQSSLSYDDYLRLIPHLHNLGFN